MAIAIHLALEGDDDHVQLTYEWPCVPRVGEQLYISTKACTERPDVAAVLDDEDLPALRDLHGDWIVTAIRWFVVCNRDARVADPEAVVIIRRSTGARGGGACRCAFGD